MHPVAKIVRDEVIQGKGFTLKHMKLSLNDGWPRHRITKRTLMWWQKSNFLEPRSPYNPLHYMVIGNDSPGDTYTGYMRKLRRECCSLTLLGCNCYGIEHRHNDFQKNHHIYRTKNKLDKLAAIYNDNIVKLRRKYEDKWVYNNLIKLNNMFWELGEKNSKESLARIDTAIDDMLGDFRDKYLRTHHNLVFEYNKPLIVSI